MPVLAPATSASLTKVTSQESRSSKSKGGGCDRTDLGYLLEKALKLEQIAKTFVGQFGSYDEEKKEWLIKEDTGAQALAATITIPEFVLTDLNGDASYDKNEVTVALNTYLGDECVDEYYDMVVSITMANDDFFVPLIRSSGRSGVSVNFTVIETRF